MTASSLFKAIQNIASLKVSNILRKTIEGYLDLNQSIAFNTIKTKLIMHAFHKCRYLKSKRMFVLSHTSTIKVQYMPK